MNNSEKGGYQPKIKNIGDIIPPKSGTDEITLVQKEQTRIRINFKISAKGDFQPDVTSEAETVETAMKNLDEAHTRLSVWARIKGYIKEVNP